MSINVTIDEKCECLIVNFKRSRETVECLYVYVTVKFAVVPPTLGLRSCQGGVRGCWLRHGARRNELGRSWGRKGKGRGTN